MSSVPVTALALPAGDHFVELLQTEWASGAAVAPVDDRLNDAELHRVLSALAPTSIIDANGERTLLPNGRSTEEGDAVVVATSGSTGTPKGVVLTHDAVQASAQMTSGHLGIDPSIDRWLCCLPVSHIGGLSVITRALATGTPLTVLPKFDADAVMRAVVAEGVTRISLVTRALTQVDPSMFRTVLLGGAAPPADRASNVIATYGSTETGSGVVYDRQTLPGVDLRVDELGQLWVKSPTLLRCYRDGTDPKVDGWYPTGDAATIGDASDEAGLSEAGVLSVSGRMGDVIVTGGEKVWPARVEPLIRSLGSVVDVVVVGRRHAEWGHEVTAVVQPADRNRPPSLEELRDVVWAQLPKWWAPRRIELVDQFPRTALGKIRRAEV